MGILVNIDNGGTFTDVCIADNKHVAYAKSPTTPHDLTLCFVSCLKRISQSRYGEEDLGRLLGETDYLRYSTTSGTNAVVERKGQPVALIVAAGEEDSVYGIKAQFSENNLWDAMVPNRPAGLKVGQDNVIDTEELLTTVAELLQAGANRIVVALPSVEAERTVKMILLDRYPRHLLGAVPFLISSDLDQDKNEARRTLSAVLNSYLHAGMEHFLYGAENICQQHHLKHPLLIYRNDGDSARVAKSTAIKTWGSGPCGGIVGTAEYAKHYNIKTLVAMDIGGTTTDVAVIKDGKFKVNSHGRVEAGVTSFTLPEMVSLGLGGSSIIQVQDAAITIGPESVGAVPGPACLGRGGKSVTLTDALFLAGVIDGENYLGGELKLDQARAQEAIQTHIAQPLNLTLDEAVMAVIEAFESQCAKHLKQIISASGSAPEDASLLAFGGGGAMIATGIAEQVGMKQVVVPELAAVFSAFGVGFSDLAHRYRRPLSTGTESELAEVRQRMQSRGERGMQTEGVAPEDCQFIYSLKYSENGEVMEAEPKGDNLKKLHGTEDFRLALKVLYPLPKPTILADVSTDTGVPADEGKTPVRVGKDRVENLSVYWAGKFKPGNRINEPALIRDDYMTCFMKAGWALRVSGNNDLILEKTA